MSEASGDPVARSNPASEPLPRDAPSAGAEADVDDWRARAQHLFAGDPPPGHVGWLVVSVLLFFPLAIVCVINYAKIDTFWYRGEAAGAERASDNVRRYGIISLCIWLVVTLITLLLAVLLYVLSRGATVVHRHR